MSRFVERVCFLLLLAVVGLRPLISESYDSAGMGFGTGVTHVRSLSPVATVLIDAVILLAACGVFARRAWGRRPTRCPGRVFLWGTMLVAAIAVVSAGGAGNRRLAGNATLDWLMLPLLTGVLVQLLRQRWHVRLLLCTVLASAAAQAVECFNQVYVTFPETEQFYDEHHEAIWAQRGAAADSPEVELFERRMKAREASGYLAHANVTGAYLIMVALVAAGIGVAAARGSRLPNVSLIAVAGTIAALLLTAAWLTHARGAGIAGVLAAILWMVRSRFADAIRRNRRRVAVLSWSTVGAVIAGTIVYGATTGRLPGDSLTFRWRYWSTSAHMFTEHWLVGVGRENYGRHYLKHKPIDSPEEISNPHNFLVTAATEWGVVGVAGILTMLIGGSLAVARRPERRHSSCRLTDRRGSLWWAPTIAAAVFAPRLFMLGTDDANYLLVATVTPLAVWLTVFVLAMGAWKEYAETETPMGSVGTAINAALFLFLLQDTINFGLYVPGAATTFFALLAASMALRLPLVNGEVGGDGSGEAQGDPGAAPITRRALLARTGPLVGPAAALAVLVVAFLLPMWRAERRAAPYRSDAWKADEPLSAAASADRALEKATNLDRLDPTWPAERVRVLRWMAMNGDDPEGKLGQALRQIDEAIRRDAQSVSLWRAKAAIALQLADLSDRRGDYQTAVAAARRAIALYPLRPEGLVELGDCLLATAEAHPDDALLNEATSCYRRALELDDTRSPEEIRRLADARRAEIIRRIEHAQALLSRRTM